MLDQIDAVFSEGNALLLSLHDEASLEAFRIDFLGKKGKLTLLSANMRNVPADQKKAVGAKLNEVRDAFTSQLSQALQNLQDAKDLASIGSTDASLPGSLLTAPGALHPLLQVRDRAILILRRMGFALATGPEIETEWHCFDALNTPADHPARNESDTFYLNDGNLLRTHTSSVQIRHMMSTKEVPIRIIAPGAAFRRDEIDATHLSVFNQLEGLYVAPKVNLGELKGTLQHLLISLFGPKTQVRFRPHFFPFTEPSFEIDIKLEVAGKAAKWIEIAGCGMVDPEVFQAVCEKRGDDLLSPQKVQGFAFGMGLERLAMITYGISDIRRFIENDTRFLSQFA
jgi:phenylalanyl-tRNA synthetase alpha chain